MIPSTEDQATARHQRLKAESLMLMAAGMAHDFNNYLAAIQGNNELVLAQSTAEAPFYRSVRQIDSLTQSALSLTHRIQIFAGQALIEPVACDPIFLLHAQKESLQGLLSAGQRLLIHHPDTCGSIMADPVLLTHALQNLVTNASEALADQKGDISISCGEITSSSGDGIDNYHHIELTAAKYVYFEVIDTGAGMEDTVMANAFDPFFTTKIRAEGMGLPVVLGVAWSHKGAIQLRSQPGEGTCIRILLPR